MRKWKKLSEFQEKSIPCGSILRVYIIEKLTKRYCRKKFFDVLVFNPGKNDACGLINISGQKSGLIRVIFPKESSETAHTGLKTDWLTSNWSKWVDGESAVSEVIIGLPQTENINYNSHILASRKVPKFAGQAPPLSSFHST